MVEVGLTEQGSPHHADDILTLIRELLETLRRSDRKVAEIVLNDPARILNATVAETAELAEVSQPTVIRFCSAIGCDGFSDLKLRLAHSLALGTPATHSVISEDDTPQVIASKIFDYTITSLDWARRKLDYQQLDLAVEMLTAARRIEFFGFGASGVVAHDAQQKFPLFDVPCGAERDMHQMMMLAGMMGKGDVAVVISNTASTASLIEMADLARKNGAKVLALVGQRGPLTEHCDVLLVLETLDNTDIYTPTISRLAALVAIDVLSTAVALRRDMQHADRFKRMKQHLALLRTRDNI
ncbi:MULTISPECIES: SIS domain-containing protein [Brucella]|uniref:SIS domain protein n=1 Tax=Brucella lupini TaxID=255457 RepID=A0A256GHJ7_9HYPH|nr:MULTISPECIES: SIS domain-containing protein [Brucella]KAB2702873.1 SIS domain-containing protein [Brucella lupini]KAB2728012.1 SIS domain-containing protein [Brucella anthropi]KAB2745184.1 SIS domain-containing protein [Brucella anthropi]KAB2800018.1 SIS domain-containing protein [Brucella anthropi]KAB2805609.1 SIS domain-containing protein [Brucella anthropi]